MGEIPLIDWNGSGQIDPQDIALSLAIAASMEDDDENEDEPSQ